MSLLPLPDGVENDGVLRILLYVGVVIRCGRTRRTESVETAGFVVSVLRFIVVGAGCLTWRHEDAGFPAGRYDGLNLQFVRLLVVGQASCVGHLAQFVPRLLVDQVHGVECPVDAYRGGAAEAARAQSLPVVQFEKDAACEAFVPVPRVGRRVVLCHLLLLWLSRLVLLLLMLWTRWAVVEAEAEGVVFLVFLDVPLLYGWERGRLSRL